ncbi:MAG TPA: anhydro-N-acetylmuramic acid kinase [Bacteroidales bacterium]|nr:anhydro-N-acetylmuramic acid kinase [Bacteroidales bacterium]
MPHNQRHLILGLMSGTSMDGVDLALCRFNKTNHNQIEYKLLLGETISYPYYITEKLEDALHLSAQDLHILDQELGEYYAGLVGNIMTRGFRPDLIASHGHTVIHQPDKGLTLQIGNGDVMAQKTGIPVISDFRIQDVSKGGQGAPLVPIGDRDLFRQYDLCLNLGGIANISLDMNEKRIACDISPCNMALNTITSWIELPFDDKGERAAQGEIQKDLLERLNSKDYYKKDPPKSLGKEWFLRTFLPEIRKTKMTVEDALRTVTEHISEQIAAFINQHINSKSQILVTGGGAYNHFLMSKIRQKCNGEIVLPDNSLINFKEAIIFAYLGYLREQNKINVLASVTGASSDTSAGVINNPN